MSQEGCGIQSKLSEHKYESKMQGQESSKRQLLAFDFPPLPELTGLSCFAEAATALLTYIRSPRCWPAFPSSAPEKLNSSVWVSKIHFSFPR